MAEGRGQRAEGRGQRAEHWTGRLLGNGRNWAAGIYAQRIGRFRFVRISSSEAFTKVPIQAASSEEGISVQLGRRFPLLFNSNRPSEGRMRKLVFKRNSR